jgi:lipoate-protein ligase B
MILAQTSSIVGVAQAVAPVAAVRAAWLGTVPYGDALALQRRLLERRQAGQIPDTILLLEHPHVFTLGRRADQGHVLADAETLRSVRAEVVETDRGGEATYHGPGQLVVYPVVSIREAGLGPVAYVRLLEETVIATLRRFGVAGHRTVGRTGVWVGGEPGARPPKGEAPKGAKIAAIGVRVGAGVAMHGFALNVATDLSYYGYIVPCGMSGLSVGSIASLTRRSPAVREAGQVAAANLTALLRRSLELVGPDALQL